MDDTTRLKRNAYMREWKKRNKSKVNKINKAWKDSNRDLVRERERGYAAKARAGDPERSRRAVRRYALAHPELVKERYAKWLYKNPGYHSEHTRRRIAKNPEWFMLYNCQKRAKRQGVPFSLTAEDVVIPEMCPVLGIPILQGHAKGRGVFSPNSPSVDRVIPSLGYVRGNTRIISARANNLKNNGTPEELMAVALYAQRETEKVQELLTAEALL